MPVSKGNQCIFSYREMPLRLGNLIAETRYLICLATPSKLPVTL